MMFISMDLKTLNIIEKIVLLVLIIITIFYREYYLIVILSLIELFIIIYRGYNDNNKEYNDTCKIFESYKKLKGNGELKSYTMSMDEINKSLDEIQKDLNEMQEVFKSLEEYHNGK